MEYVCNTPVLMIFFNRPESFSKVFEQVRIVKPKTLILAQDGPRNEEDIPKIEACRKVVENIDWECEVIKDYSAVNLGCGVRPKSAIDLALSKFERVIILEDDCVPSSTFFNYCDQLLARYQNDERIAYISGLNHFEIWDCGNYDYFFSRAAAIGGWATWRRAWTCFYDYYAEGINDEYRLRLYKQQVGNKTVYEQRLLSLQQANNSAKNGKKLSYWDTQWGFAEFTQNMLAIVPRVNQICNIGVGGDSTHAKTLNTTRYVKNKNMVFIPTYEFQFPLRHPNFCACDMEYHFRVYKMAQGTWPKRILRKIKKRFIKKPKFF